MYNIRKLVGVVHILLAGSTSAASWCGGTDGVARGGGVGRGAACWRATLGSPRRGGWLRRCVFVRGCATPRHQQCLLCAWCAPHHVAESTSGRAHAWLRDRWSDMLWVRGAACKRIVWTVRSTPRTQHRNRVHGLQEFAESVRGTVLGSRPTTDSWWRGGVCVIALVVRSITVR